MVGCGAHQLLHNEEARFSGKLGVRGGGGRREQDCVEVAEPHHVRGGPAEDIEEFIIRDVL